MHVDLTEAKAYLRVDANDEDDLIKSLLGSAEKQVQAVTRFSDEEYAKDDPVMLYVLYTFRIFLEQQEEADRVTLTLCSGLFFSEYGRRDSDGYRGIESPDYLPEAGRENR